VASPAYDYEGYQSTLVSPGSTLERQRVVADRQAVKQATFITPAEDAFKYQNVAAPQVPAFYSGTGKDASGFPSPAEDAFRYQDVAVPVPGALRAPVGPQIAPYAGGSRFTESKGVNKWESSIVAEALNSPEERVVVPVPGSINSMGRLENSLGEWVTVGYGRSGGGYGTLKIPIPAEDLNWYHRVHKGGRVYGEISYEAPEGTKVIRFEPQGY